MKEQDKHTQGFLNKSTKLFPKENKGYSLKLGQGLIDKEMAWEISTNKVVFLNEKNLEILKGYKAHATLKSNFFRSKFVEIQITITGLSSQAADKLFESLERMKETEIKGT